MRKLCVLTAATAFALSLSACKDKEEAPAVKEYAAAPAEASASAAEESAVPVASESAAM